LTSGAASGAARQPAEVPEVSLGLAGAVIKARYRVNAVSSVSRDVVLYTAEDVRNGRSIALKVLREEVARDAAFVAAVRKQADALAAAAHVLRGVQRVYEFGTTDTGLFFVALEWAEGATLREVLDAGSQLAEPTALRIAVRVGEALEALHHNQVLHGHLGPDSVVMVTDGERIRLVGVELTAAYRTPIGLRLRETFSPAYRAPEQIARGEATEATDVYALGMLLRELVGPSRAGQGSSTVAEPTRLSPAIARVISTALEVRPERRYPDISMMVNDIWGAAAALAESEPRARSVKARGNPRRRVRRRRLPIALNVTAAAMAGGIVLALVWDAGLDRIVSRFHVRVAPPPVTAIPVQPETRPPSDAPSPDAPSLAGPTLEPPPLPRAEIRAVKDESTPERRAPVVVKPRPAPAVMRQPPVASSVAGGPVRPAIEARPPAEPRASVESSAPIERQAPAEPPARPERSATPGGDGSAVIDWLLNRR
jgi:serine/threonine-protein kinase